MGEDLGYVMIFREEMVHIWHIFTCFGFFLFFMTHLFCPVNRKEYSFLIRIFSLLFFFFKKKKNQEYIRLEARSLTPANFLWWGRGFSSLVSSWFSVWVSALSFQDGIDPAPTWSKGHQPTAWHGESGWFSQCCSCRLWFKGSQIESQLKTYKCHGILRGECL